MIGALAKTVLIALPTLPLKCEWDTTMGSDVEVGVVSYENAAPEPAAASLSLNVEPLIIKVAPRALSPPPAMTAFAGVAEVRFTLQLRTVEVMTEWWPFSREIPPPFALL